MNAPAIRGAWAAGILVVWYVLVGPRAVDAISRGRTVATRPPGLHDLRGYAAAHRERVGPEVVALFTEGARLEAREQQWSRLMAGMLTPEERTDGAARGADLTPAVPRRRRSEPDPEAVALLVELVDRYGYAEVEVPTAPSDDPWRGAGRADRARALRALAIDPGLPPEVAHQVIIATLDLLEAQRRRMDIEREIWSLMADGRAAGFGE